MIFHSDRINIFYEVFENTLYEDTVFLHGNLASSWWWRPTVQAFKELPGEKRGRALLIDWRGCGRSSIMPPDMIWEPEAAAKDCLEIIKMARFSPCLLVGHSTGGLLGQYCLEWDERRFSGLLLLDSVSPSGVILNDQLREAFLKMATDRATCADVFSEIIRGAKKSNPWFQKAVSDAMSVAPQIWQGVPEALTRIKNPPKNAHFFKKVLVCHGEFDSVLDITDSQKLAEQFEYGEFKTIPNAGHSYNVENPVGFAKILASISSTKEIDAR